MGTSHDILQEKLDSANYKIDYLLDIIAQYVPYEELEGIEEELPSEDVKILESKRNHLFMERLRGFLPKNKKAKSVSHSTDGNVDTYEFIFDKDVKIWEDEIYHFKKYVEGETGIPPIRDLYLTTTSTYENDPCLVLVLVLYHYGE